MRSAAITALLFVALLLVAIGCARFLARAKAGRRAEVFGGRKEPGVLFHGSPHELTAIEPRPSLVVGREPMVFGTSSRWLALVFSTQARSKDLDYGYAKGRPYIAEMREGAFDHLKRAGYVYTIPAAGFRSDPRLGMPGREYVKKGGVSVLEGERVPDVLEDLRRFPALRMVPADERLAFCAENGIPPD